MRQTRGKVLIAALAVVGVTLSLLTVNNVSAAQITNRSLELIGSGNDGGSKPGGTVNHRFTFDVPTSGTLGSIRFEYCDTASVETCVAPTNMDATGATFGNEDDSEITGFSMGARTANSFILTRTANSIAGGETAELQANSVVNPSPVNYTFFVRITTYASTDGSGSPIDSGSVAATTAEAIELTGTMPESLIFCTGAPVGVNGSSVPDCTTATPGDVTFNQLFSPTDTATASSQMAASTNAGTGYAISVNGPTLTSGANTIPAISAGGGAASSPGTGQFGMNLRANTVAAAASFPGDSADISPASNGTDLRGQATGDYATADTFKYVSGETVANSAFNTAGPTNAQIFTASYIVNVPGNQLAGTYTTTLTYICTPTF